MRYHVGMGVGHLYNSTSKHRSLASRSSENTEKTRDGNLESDFSPMSEESDFFPQSPVFEDGSDLDDPELGLESREDDLLEMDGDDDDDEYSDEELVLAFDDMYPETDP